MASRPAQYHGLALLPCNAIPLEVLAESRVRSNAVPLSSATALASGQTREAAPSWRILFKPAVLTGGAGGGPAAAGSTGAAELGMGP